MVQWLKFFVEQRAWFVIRRQVRLIRKFRIGTSLSNRNRPIQIESRSFAGAQSRNDPLCVDQDAKLCALTLSSRMNLSIVYVCILVFL